MNGRPYVTSLFEDRCRQISSGCADVARSVAPVPRGRRDSQRL